MAPTNKYNINNLKDSIENGEIDFVRVEVPDTYGISRGLHLDANYFLNSYKKGFSEPQALFSLTPQGEFASGTGLTDEITYRNGFWIPELDSLRVLPWVDKTASVLADAYIPQENSSKISENLQPCAPRNICRQQTYDLNSAGYNLYSSFEYEFYMLDPQTHKPISDDANFISTHHTARFAHLANDFMRNLRAIGIRPEHFHSETGPSQLELTCSPEYDLQSADNAFRYKQLIKEVSRKHGYTANFMTKPFPNECGSSGHYNHSVWNGDVNVLYDPECENGLSKVGRNWMAGLVHHTDAILCLSNQTPNCYERTNVGNFAPMHNAWGFDNRSVSYRVKNHGTDNMYIEVRIGGAGTNPYLLQAGCIVAGMDGIRRDLQLGDPFEEELTKESTLPEHVKALPQSLMDAIECFKKDEVFSKAFGDEFIKVFSALKKHECDLAAKQGKDELFNWYMSYYGEYL